MNSIFMITVLLWTSNPVSESTPLRALYEIVTHERFSEGVKDNDYNTTDWWFQDGQLHARVKRGTLPPFDKQKLLDYHNRVRKDEGASNMIKLKWDENLAKNSKKWSLNCKFDHPSYVGNILGQNLHFTSGSLLYKDYLSGLEDWFNEKKDYDFNSKACRSVCAHYTTMVKWDFIQLGCSVVKCPYLHAFGKIIENAAYLSCEYYTKIKDHSSYPYKRGSACSECPESHKNCEDKLCTGPDSSYPPWDSTEVPAHAFNRGDSCGICFFIKLSLLIHMIIKSYF